MKPAISAPRAGVRSSRPAQPPRAPSREHVPLRDLTDCLTEAYECLSRVAGETLLACGENPSAEREELRRVEREIMPWLPVDFEESEEFVRVLATASGFRAADVWVGIEPFWLAILARREGNESPDGPAAPPEAGGQQSRGPIQTFCVCTLPAEVNPNHSVAVLANGLLAIRMPKVHRRRGLRERNCSAEGAPANGARSENMAPRKLLSSSLRLWWQSLRAKSGGISATSLPVK